MYRLGLLTHLQNGEVPLKVPECLRDLTLMYEAVTIDDINEAYSHFQMDNEHVFTCVGTSGPTPPPQRSGTQLVSAQPQPRFSTSQRSERRGPPNGGSNGEVPVGKAKGMDGKVLLSVAAALQGSGLAQAMQELTNRISREEQQ
jgi:hypothetical protein